MRLIVITNILIALISISMACHSKPRTNNIADSIVAQNNQDTTSQLNKTNDLIITKVVQLTYGFKVTAGREDDFGNFKTYTLFRLCRNNKEIYADSSLTEYEFGDTLYPIVIKTSKNTFELLFEVNDRPNKNYLKRLIIKDDLVMGEDKLPTFISKPKDINGDGLIEYAGFWDSFETWGENNNSLTDYNPILYYTLTTSGLKLDSLLTKQKNTLIYGDFKGYEFNEKIVMPVSVINKFDKEITLINNIH